MAEPTIATMVTQLGAEATALPGTPVTCNRRLQATGIKFGPQVDEDVFRPEGSKWVTVAQPTGQATTFDLDGRPSYNELPYLLCSLLKDVTPVQILDAATPTGGYRWTWAPATTGEDTPRPFTMEKGTPGGTTRARRFSYGLVNEVGMSFERGSEPSLSGGGIGQAMTDGITMNTTGVTTVDPVPVMAHTVDLFYDPTSAALGTTKLARVRTAEWTLGDRYNPLWVLDSSKGSWAAHVENAEPTCELALTVVADAQQGTLLTDQLAGTTKFLRLQATGPVIYTGGLTVNYSLKFDMAVKVTDVGDYADDDGVQVLDFTLTAAHDATWGKAMTLELINKLTAL